MQLLKGDGHPITAIAFSPDGTYLASASEQELVRLHQLTSGDVSRSFAFRDHRPGIVVTGFAFHPNGSRLVACRHPTAQIRKVVRLGVWELPDFERFTTLKTRISRRLSLAIEPTSNSFLLFGNIFGAIGTRMERWRLDSFDAASPEYDPTPQVLPGWYAWFPWREELSRLTAGRRWIAVAARDGPQVGFQNRHQPGRIRTFKPHPSSIRALAMHPTENLLVTAGPKEARVWELPRRHLIGELPRSGTQLYHALAFSPDGRLLAIGRNSGLVTWWDTTTWTETGTFIWPISHVHCLAFAPDGLRIAAGGENGDIIVWDVE